LTTGHNFHLLGVWNDWRATLHIMLFASAKDFHNTVTALRGKTCHSSRHRRFI
jgi:hypothetical protein